MAAALLCHPWGSRGCQNGKLAVSIRPLGCAAHCHDLRGVVDAPACGRKIRCRSTELKAATPLSNPGPSTSRTALHSLEVRPRSKAPQFHMESLPKGCLLVEFACDAPSWHHEIPESTFRCSAFFEKCGSNGERAFFEITFLPPTADSDAVCGRRLDRALSLCSTRRASLRSFGVDGEGCRGPRRAWISTIKLH